MATTESKPVRVTKTPLGIYEFALPEYGVFTLSGLKQVDLFFKRHKLNYNIIKAKANFSNEPL